MKNLLVAIVVTVACFCSFSTSAHALDKRLKLAFKTAGYGAGAGFVLGAGSMALGMGGARNILMGTSAGMYAGILLAAYIIATPSEDAAASHGPRKNPFAPRRPVGPDDYDDSDREDFGDHLPPEKEDGASLEFESRPGFPVWPGSESELKGNSVREVAVWTPLVQLAW